jgi:Flp pilus assembly protein TadG
MFKLILVAAAIAAIWYYLRRPAVTSIAEDEARAILDLGPDADAAAVRDAHRRLVTALHPDKGGSTELTRKINAARDVLLKRARH